MATPFLKIWVSVLKICKAISVLFPHKTGPIIVIEPINIGPLLYFLIFLI